jgi:hypothetical protein
MSLEEGFETMEKGVELAWQLRHLDNEKLPESLPAPPLNLCEIKRIFGIGAEIILPSRISHVFKTKVLGSLPKSGATHQVEFKANKFPFFYNRDADKICDAEEVAVSLTESLTNVLKCFFEQDGQGIKSQLTFAEIAEKYKQNLKDEDNEIEVARNFQRELHDQLYKKYGLKNTKEILESWQNNGYQLGKEGWNFSKTKRAIDAMERPKFSIDENIALKSDRKTSSIKPSSE